MSATAYPATDGSQPCRQVDADLFFPDVGGGGERAWDVAKAIDICRTCHFVDGCLGYALANDVTGIWGGTTHLRRKQIRRQRGLTATAPAMGVSA